MEFIKAILQFFADILKKRWLLLAILPLGIVPISMLTTLAKDGLEILDLQKTTLLLDVYARTDLPSDVYPLLEESLQALLGVREVVAVSPEESLDKAVQDTTLGIDAAWLKQKMADLKGKDTLLPWSYKIYPEEWDSLLELIREIESIEVGRLKIKAVSEVHYDRERWALTSALFNYGTWIRRSLWVLLIAGLGVGAFLAFRARPYFQKENLAKKAGEFLLLALLGGLISHGLLLGVLSQSFFPEIFNWKIAVGRSLPLELALSIYFCLCAHAALVFERRN